MPTIDAGDLSVAYLEFGRAGDPAVLLLHGWPDDASSWDKVAPGLAAAGYHVVAPMLRGFAGTRFRDPHAARTANSGILAMDAIALLDALGLGTVRVAGHDWGSNIAEALAVGWPDRVSHIALLSTPPRLGGMPTPPFWHAQLEWYHWFMATARGAAKVREEPKAFAHVHWRNWSPPGWFAEPTFAAVATSFDNPDWVDVTLHSYRARWDEAEPDPRSRWLEEKVKTTPTLSLPAIYIQGAEDGVNPPAAAKDVPAKFTGAFRFVQLGGVGHFAQREAPAQVLDALLQLFAIEAVPAA